MRPVAPRLAIHPADLRGITSAHTVKDGSQCQKTADLPIVTTALGQSAKLGGVIVVSELDGLAWRISLASLE